MHAMHNIGKVLFVTILLNLLLSQREDWALLLFFVSTMVEENKRHAK